MSIRLHGFPPHQALPGAISAQFCRGRGSPERGHRYCVNVPAAGQISARWAEFPPGGTGTAAHHREQRTNQIRAEMHGKGRASNPCGPSVYAHPSGEMCARSAGGTLRPSLWRCATAWPPESRRGIDRAWWTEVLHENVDAELDWLRATIYRTAGVPLIPQRRITTYDRWRADPSDVAALPPMSPDYPGRGVGPLAPHLVSRAASRYPTHLSTTRPPRGGRSNNGTMAR